MPGPNGTKIAFASDRDGNLEVYVMNADGSAQTRLTNNAAPDVEPSWSPDGSKIAFRSGSFPEIYVMNADGSGQTNLTNTPTSDIGPAWSPDGSKIAFTATRDSNNEIYVMNADGSGQTNLTNNSASDLLPDWQSLTDGGTNTAPTCNNGSASTNEDNAVAATLSCTDADADALSYSIVTSPAHGHLSGTAPNLTYTPNANYNGPDSFAFKVNDGEADSNTATFFVTVSAVNDAPVADPQSITTTENTTMGVTLSASDIEGDTLTYSVVAPPAHGSLSGTPPSLSYTPANNYNGPDSFTFKANDGSADSNTATISITVSPANSPPIADLLLSPTAGSSPLDVLADASSSFDPDGESIVSYTFDFGDGTGFGPSNQATVVHTYGAPGAYSVTVTAADAAGAEGTDQLTVIVSESAPPQPGPGKSPKARAAQKCTVYYGGTDYFNGPRDCFWPASGWRGLLTASNCNRVNSSFTAVVEKFANVSSGTVNYFRLSLIKQQQVYSIAGNVYWKNRDKASVNNSGNSFSDNTTIYRSFTGSFTSGSIPAGVWRVRVRYEAMNKLAARQDQPIYYWEGTVCTFN